MQTLEDDKQVDKSSENFDDIINRNFSPDEISDMEDRASEGLDDSKSEVDSERESLDKGGYYRPDKDSDSNDAQATSNKKKAGIGIGVIGLLFGGGLGIFGLLAQPLQFLQMAGMLRNFHFSDGENLSDSRMTRISRYIKYGGDERTRLSYLGNKYANKVEAKLNKSGLKSTYTGKGSRFSGYEVDLTKNSEALGDISNKSPDEVTKMLADRYGIDPSKITSSGTNKLNISADGLNTRESKRLLRNSLADAGYSRVGAAMRARIMGKRGLVTWNPIKKFDTKIKASAKARIADFYEARKNRINNGADAPLRGVSENQNDPDGDGTADTDPDSNNAADSANNAPNDTPDNLKNKISGRVGGAAAVVGILCIAEALSSQYDEIKHANVVLPLIRLGVEGMAVGDQILTGENLDPAQLDAMTELMYSEETQTSYRTARSIQYEAGEELTGKDVLPEAKIDSNGNVLSQIMEKIPLLGPTCDILNNTIVSFGLSLVSGGPISLIVDIATGPAVASLINGLVNWIAGNPIDVQVAGADYGNYINYGARLAANDANISAGGVKLTSAEVAELRSIRLGEENYEFSQKSFFAKIFDAKDYKTPAGKFIANQAPDPAQNIARVASSAPRFLGNIFSPITSLLTTKTGASEDYDYGFDKYGFANSEIESSVIENPFENDEIVANLLDAKAAEISEKTTKCFGIKIEKKTIGGKSVWAPVSVNEVPQYKDIDEECSDRSEEFLRIRMWIHDSQLMTATACFEDGEENTCEDFGFTASASSATASSVQELNCEGYYKFNNKPANIVNGIPEGEYVVPYSSKEKSTCESLRTQCSSGVSGSVKAICSALELDKVYYGSTGMQDRAEEFYGFRVETNALQNVVNWFKNRELGLTSTNVMECSALTNAAVYKAFGYSGGMGCSGNWSSANHPTRLQSVASTDVQPGDFLTTTRGCNLGANAVRGSHIAIAASAPDSNGNLVIYESSAHGTTTHFRDVNISDFKDGYMTRWIGPGL